MARIAAFAALGALLAHWLPLVVFQNQMDHYQASWGWSSGGGSGGNPRPRPQPAPTRRRRAPVRRRRAPVRRRRAPTRRRRTPPPAPPPTTPPTEVCPGSGLSMHDRTWYLSCVGDSCATTCSSKGLVVDWFVASDGQAMVPQLLGFEPATKQFAWGSMECYVDGEDRYHTASSAGEGVADPGSWAFSTCRLACPCGQTPTPGPTPRATRVPPTPVPTPRPTRAPPTPTPTLPPTRPPPTPTPTSAPTAALTPVPTRIPTSLPTSAPPTPLPTTPTPTVGCPVTFAGGCENWNDKTLGINLDDKAYTVMECFEQCSTTQDCGGFFMATSASSCLLVRSGCVSNGSPSFSYFGMNTCYKTLTPTAAPSPAPTPAPTRAPTPTPPTPAPPTLTPPTTTPTAAPTPTPTTDSSTLVQAAEASSPEVNLAFSIQNVAFSSMTEAHKSEMTSGIKTTVATNTGVLESNIAVALSAGSVAVDVTIKVPDQMDVTTVQSTVDGNQTAITAAVVSEVAVIAGLPTTGAISVSGFTVMSQKVQSAASPSAPPALSSARASKEKRRRNRRRKARAAPTTKRKRKARTARSSTPRKQKASPSPRKDKVGSAGSVVPRNDA